ncbi:MAG: protease complex subunit PrcB family protein [Lachnospiraceae bacterium]|nr:protease complex subunit PrcB family protein [Lachnospiraceae bacterium]
MILCFGCIFCLLITMGCGEKSSEITKVKDLDFTVVEEADIPEELLTLINKKKKNTFCLTYKSENACYICQGFGTQMTSGYSITVEELFLGTNAIYIKNTLLGPGKDELVTQNATHPYIVVKIELMDYNVVFE